MNVYPFVPNCFDINSTISSCYPVEPTDDFRNFIVLTGTPVTIEEPYSGDGWVGAKKVYMRSDPQEFNDGWYSNFTSLASNAYVSHLFNDRMILPHTILRITLNVHAENDIISEIVMTISWLYDNTRGRMQKYPFIDIDGHSTAAEIYDVIFYPKFKYDPDGHQYDTGRSSG